MVEFFCDKMDMKKNNKAFYPLIFYATPKNSIEIIKLLLAKGVDINERLYTTDETALHHAIYYSKKELIEFLILNGADINALNKDFETPLMCTIALDKPDIAELLLKNGADPDIKNKDGYTALEIAEQQEKPDQSLIELLKKYSKQK